MYQKPFQSSTLTKILSSPKLKVPSSFLFLITLYLAQQTLSLLNQYAFYLILLFSEELLTAKDHPAAAIGLTLTAGLFLMRGLLFFSTPLPILLNLVSPFFS
jgi:hypothetical protein